MLDTATAKAKEEWLFGLGRNKAAPDELAVEIFNLPAAGWRRTSFLYDPNVRDAILDAAISHPGRTVRILAAETGHLTPDQWDRLIETFTDTATRDLLAEIRADWAAARNRPRTGVGIAPPPHPDATPPTTPAEIAEWAAAAENITADDFCIALWWVAALHDDPDAMRQLAASPKLLVRRSVARARHLPPDVVDRLGRDEDRVVHLFLTESCDDTPAEVLMSVWSWWPGSFSFPGRPRDHPNFPKTGLLRYADDPDPRMRLLAVADEASSAELVDRFAGDPDPRVRDEAAGDPRISPEALVKLLLDERHAHAAARNASIPIPVMRRMIGLAGQAAVPAE